jgi:hypothetical protein
MTVFKAIKQSCVYIWGSMDVDVEVEVKVEIEVGEQKRRKK